MYYAQGHPIITLNQLADLMKEKDAGKRCELVKMKEPLQVQNNGKHVQSIRRKLQEFLLQPSCGIASSGESIAALERNLRHFHGQEGNGIRKDLAMIKAYRGIFSRRFAKCKFGNTEALSTYISGVKVEAVLDATLSQNIGGIQRTGGIVLLTDMSTEIKEFRAYYRRVSSLLYWILSDNRRTTVSDLCILVDLVRGKVIRAPKQNERFQRDASLACEEIFRFWNMK